VTSPALHHCYLARHGETEWSRAGRHTGLTDLPLTAVGERDAARLGPRLAGISFSQVWTSPLRRASRTCELAGFGSRAVLDPDLLEWNYGDYEGLRSAEILERRPGWQLFRDGCPGGESPADVAARADRLVQRARAVDGNVLVFSSGHLLRLLAARWLGREPGLGALLYIGTAGLGILGYEHTLAEPVIRLWNDSGTLEH
jgi:probable phosphoglycerate mutase